MLRPYLPWILPGLILLLLQSGWSEHPEWIEQYYSRGIFPYIRWTLDHTIGWLPLPVFYWLLPGLILWLLYRAVKTIRAPHSNWGRKLGHLGLGILSVGLTLVFAFQVLWGLNYQRQSLEQLLGLTTAPLDQEQTFEELRLATQELLETRTLLAEDSTACPLIEARFQVVKPVVDQALKAFFKKHYLPHQYQPPARRLHPRGILLRISTAGFYMPLTGECNLDAGLHPLQVPFVLAHEYGHGYGFGPEDACNFLAWVSCREAESPFARYAGLLGYWRYVASSARRLDPNAYAQFWKTLPEGIKKDLRAIRAEMNKYPDLFPKVRDMAYDTYLKSQGVQEGQKNYSRVVVLAYAWRKQKM